MIAVAADDRPPGRGRRARVLRARRAAAASTGCAAQLDALAPPTRTQRWALQAVREDCLGARGRRSCARRSPESARRAGRAGRGRVRRAPRRAGPPARRRHALAQRRRHQRPARADARRPRTARSRRLMAAPGRSGPLLRYAGETEATVWVETDAPCEVEVLGCARARRSASHGHHYALVHVTRARARRDDAVRGAARRRAGLAAAGQRRSRRACIRTPRPRRRRRGSCSAPAACAAPHEPPLLAAQGRATRAAARSTRCARSRMRMARSDPRGVAARAAAARRPGLRRRGLARRVRLHPLAARPRASRRARRSPTSRSTRCSTASRGASRTSAGCSRRCRRAMIFDDHDVHRRLEHVARRGSTDMRGDRLVGRPHRRRASCPTGSTSTSGNLSPDELAEDELYARRCARTRRRRRDVLREFAFARRPRGRGHALELLPRHRPARAW